MIKRMFMYLGVMVFFLGASLVGFAAYEYNKVPLKGQPQRVEIPCDAFGGDVDVVVTVEVTNMALTKENMELLNKKVCGSVVKRII